MSAAQFVGHMFYANGQTLTETYEQAVEHYKAAYGHPPATVYINPHTPIDEILTDGNVVIQHSAYILPGCLLAAEK